MLKELGNRMAAQQYLECWHSTLTLSSFYHSDDLGIFQPSFFVFCLDFSAIVLLPVCCSDSRVCTFTVRQLTGQGKKLEPGHVYLIASLLCTPVLQ